MTKVKICGLTRMKDIEYVNHAHPGYVGFVFAKSRRRVTPCIAREMIKNLDPAIKKVGVFVNEDAEKVNEVAELCNLDIIQLHGEETPYYCTMIHKPIWKAVRIKDSVHFEQFEQYNAEAILLDTFSAKAYGGSGEAFDWNVAKGIGEKYKIILAGGINRENMFEAIDIVHPYCIDVSSGVETEGVKDDMKIKNIIDKVRIGG